ncbi:Meiosis-specific protein ASY1 [Camellia lanceoleosa]|uniref:Meiosis-specific protein ASY1 n=1 Tax=Camellia lanceoleosa TaxID=1840588 RepID=A0ACC0FWG4_9ERIC|nr:Meiosis-specific protein ASY1 [Camellia lanceoleosa]
MSTSLQPLPISLTVDSSSLLPYKGTLGPLFENFKLMFVKSVLNPCEDENDDIQDDDVSLGADSVQMECSKSDSEIGLSENDQYIVAPIDKQWANENGGMVDEDDTQDPAEVEQQLDRVKDWISCYHLETIELINVPSNFRSISLALIEEIMDKLVKEGILFKDGTDCYTIDKQKEEMVGQVVPGKKA